MALQHKMNAELVLQELGMYCYKHLVSILCVLVYVVSLLHDLQFSFCKVLQVMQLLVAAVMSVSSLP